MECGWRGVGGVAWRESLVGPWPLGNADAGPGARLVEKQWRLLLRGSVASADHTHLLHDDRQDLLWRGARSVQDSLHSSHRTGPDRTGPDQTALHCITSHCIEVHCIALHHITLHYMGITSGGGAASAASISRKVCSRMCLQETHSAAPMRECSRICSALLCSSDLTSQWSRAGARSHNAPAWREWLAGVFFRSPSTCARARFGAPAREAEQAAEPRPELVHAAPALGAVRRRRLVQHTSRVARAARGVDPL